MVIGVLRTPAAPRGDGRLGHSSTDYLYEPHIIEALRGVRVSAIAAGGQSSLAVAAGGGAALSMAGAVAGSA
jgi:hypothetical protein